jgi:hypothetical protein
MRGSMMMMTLRNHDGSILSLSILVAALGLVQNNTRANTR